MNLQHKLLLGSAILSERYLFHGGENSDVIPDQFSTTKILAKLGYIYDYIQPFYYQLDGWRNQTFFTHVWGNSITQNSTFYSLENELKYFKRLKEKVNLAVRFRLGFARNIDAPFPPFAIDNNRNVRGAGNLIQRGNALWAINTEYRHQLLEKKWLAVQANVFIDLAGIQPVNTSLDQLFYKENIYQYGGIGVRFIHKFIFKAILRIDYGINLKSFDNSAFVFGIDQYF